MNAIPAQDFTPEISPGNAKAALTAADATKGNAYYYVDPTKLQVLDGFNVRIRGTKEWEDQVTALVNSIRANGFLPDKPISVVVDKVDDEDVMWVIDGHTRLEAVNRLIAEGFEIETVPIIVKPSSTNGEEMLVNLVTSNSGTPLTAMEKAIVVARLQNFGWDDAKIATKLGMSKQYIADLAVLAGAPSAVRNLVISGKVSSSLAVETVRKHGKGAIEILKAAQGKAAESGRSKVMPKDVTPKAKDKRKKKDKAPAAEGAKTADAALLQGAIDYALTVPADGLEWLRRWNAGDADARGELEAYLDPDGGL